jgi:hypothetical protein
MRILGVLLILVGIAGLTFGSFSYTHSENVADLGPVKIQREERKTIPITPLASGAALVAGIALVVAGSGGRS